ncbi:MAG: B12-binding domain-containing radical SAM protein [Clostridia bacterium]|nr:B12-binding domain-containing radical SAM protein [Clostridia bacterium]
MNIMLINPKFDRYTRTLCTPSGLLSIASYLEQHGHKVKFLNRAFKETDIRKEFDSFKPQIIGCSFLSPMPLKDAIAVSTEAKKRGIFVVWGGPFVSSVPELCLSLGCFDTISLGEGEQTWLELAETFEKGEDWHNIKGLAYLQEGKLVKTEEREFLDLSTLPPINYEHIEDFEALFLTYYDYDGVFGMYLSKGCTQNCTFCYNRGFHNNCRRQRPIEVVIEEAKYLKEKHGIKAIGFQDELFAGNKQNLAEICHAFIDANLGLYWGCMTRIGIFDEEDFQLMYDAGCRWIEFGVESGSRSELKRMKKGLVPERVPVDLQICNKIGITTLCYFIVGFPDETEEELKETCKLINSIPYSRVVCSYYNPLPGSEAFEKLVAEGRFTPPTNIEDYMKVKVLYSPKPNLSKVSTKDLKAVRCSMLWKSFTQQRFNKGEKKLWSTARKDIADALLLLTGHGLKRGIEQFFITAYEFLDIFFYANFFPKTIKKYGLKRH